MKISFLIAALILLGCSTEPRIFIVRHAERSTEPPDNPHLSMEGQQRARDLEATLKGKKISRIYSTETNRTKETAQPLSQAIGKPIRIYKNDTIKAMLLRIIESGDNTLVVGHSNTILTMLDDLQIQHHVKEIPDNDYDNLFVIKIKRKSLTGYSFGLRETTYGSLSPAEGDTSHPNMMR